LHSDLTRRELLALPLAAALAGCRPPYRREDFAVPQSSAVGLFAAPTYQADLSDIIYRGMGTLGVRVHGKRILLKPNLVEYERETCINTHPLVVAGAIEALRRAGAASVVVGEGPGHRRDLEYLLVASGLFEHLRELKAPIVDLNHDDVRSVALRRWYSGMRSLHLPVSVLDADLVVSVPKLKTHHWAGMTCGMKNLFGCVPGAVYGWPKNLLHQVGIDESIVDLNATIRPGLTIVDAIVGMEGDGPIKGSPHPLGFIAMGTDTAAVDATCARAIGLDPEKLRYLERASHFLGNVTPDRVRQRGESIGRFARPAKVVDHARGLLLD
jgi:uncharacterized protein (DUF362 family)